MIKEQALVIAVEEHAVLVQTQRTSTCGSCESKQGCGTAVLAKGMGQGTTRLRIQTDLDVKVGDRVILAIDESALLIGSLLIYLLPLLALILGGLLGDYGTRLLELDNELLSIGLGIVALVSCLLLIRFNPHARRYQQGIQPKMTEILP